jgi:hypothetical protein
LPKKTVEEIVSCGNRYIIQVKGNQPSLLKQVKKNTSEEESCIDSYLEETRKRGRHEIRKTFIYRDISNISTEWTGLKRLIRVERHVIFSFPPQKYTSITLG